MITAIEQNDIARVINDENMLPLFGKRLLITGATGLIGSFFIKCIMRLNAEKNANISVLALVRSSEKAARVFADFAEDKRLQFIVGDICKVTSVDFEVDYIIHAASVTGSRDMVEKPVETIDIAIRGTENMLEIARDQKNLRGFLYMSSLEVYGVTDPALDKIRENDYGYIDQLNVRSSYSLGKRMVECLCASYASEYGVPVKIIRLTQTFGTGVDYNDGRVFADFARCVIEGRNIVLHTKGETVRNYCYLSDAITAIAVALVKGDMGQAYNVANEDTAISIYDMAQLLCRLYPEKGVGVVVEDNGDAAKMGYNPTIKVRLCTEKLRALGWDAAVGLEQMFKNLIEDMKSRR